MATFMCLLMKPLPWIAFLVPFLVCVGSSGNGFPSIFFTTSVLILSSIFYICSKRRPVAVMGSVKDECLRPDQECSAEVESEIESITQKKRAQGDDQADQILHTYSVRSPELCSESESTGHSSTSEDSEVDWPYSGNVDQSPDCSDDSISDEEGMIEIALPSGHFVGTKEEDSKSILKPKELPDFSPASIFQPRALLQHLAEINEMNEEENLIEIDISMGSIKCSRFEIEA